MTHISHVADIYITDITVNAKDVIQRLLLAKSITRINTFECKNKKLKIKNSFLLMVSGKRPKYQ